MFKGNPLGNKIRYYSNFIMVAVYLSVGLLFLCSDIGIDTFPEYRKGVGITMVVYAIIRFFLTRHKYKNISEDE